MTPGYCSFAPPCHTTFNIFGQGIEVDKVGEVGCPGREGESVRINKESNGNKFPLAGVSRVTGSYYENEQGQLKPPQKRFQCDEFRKRCFRAEAIHWSGFVTHCHSLMASCDTNWGKCSTFQMGLMERWCSLNTTFSNYIPAFKCMKKRVY